VTSKRYELTHLTDIMSLLLIKRDFGHKIVDYGVGCHS
jgi:hypothetical protein